MIQSVKKYLALGSMALVTFALPLVVSAADSNSTNYEKIKEIPDVIQSILDKLVPIALSLALLYFIYGLAKFILASGDPEKAEEGKNRMIWGVLALFVIVAVWGIVGFIANVFGLKTGQAVNPPGVNTYHRNSSGEVIVPPPTQ